MFNKINKNIISILGINNLPLSLQKDAIESLGGIVYQEAAVRALNILGKEDKDELEQITEKNPNPEKIFDFLSSKVVNFEEIIKEEAEKLNEETKDIMSKIGK